MRHTRRAKPFCLSFEDGLLSELSRGGEESCDIVLSVPLEAVASLLGTRHISPLLAESIEVHYPAEALAPVAMPPFDEMKEPCFEALPAMEGASANVRLDLKASPVGRLAYFVSFIDGMRGACGARGAFAPDVIIEMRFLDFLRLRAGTVSLLEVLESGHIEGRLAQMSVVGGIVGSSAYRQAWRVCSARADAVVMEHLTMIFAGGGFSALSEWVAQSTSMPRYTLS